MPNHGANSFFECLKRQVSHLGYCKWDCNETRLEQSTFVLDARQIRHPLCIHFMKKRPYSFAGRVFVSPWVVTAVPGVPSVDHPQGRDANCPNVSLLCVPGHLSLGGKPANRTTGAKCDR